MRLRWRPELWLDLRARGCQARLMGPGWTPRGLAAASSSGRGAAALAAALAALQLAEVALPPGRVRLQIADEYLLHLLLHHGGPLQAVQRQARQRFDDILGPGERHLIVQALTPQRWLASAIEAADLAAWSGVLHQAGLRPGRIVPGLHEEWQQVGRHVRDPDAVLVLPRDEGATLLRLIDGEPVDLSWERLDSDDPGALDRRVRAFARLPQGAARRPAWALSDGDLRQLPRPHAAPTSAQAIYLLPESGTLCRYVIDRSSDA